MSTNMDTPFLSGIPEVIRFANKNVIDLGNQLLYEADGQTVATNWANGIDPFSLGLTDQTFIFEGDSITAGTGTTANYGYFASQGRYISGHGSYVNVGTGSCQIPAGT